MTVCPLVPAVSFEGRCTQTQCPFSTELEADGCWHGCSQITVDAILRYKQADAEERRKFRDYIKGLREDLARVELIRSYRWSVQNEAPTEEDRNIWEGLRGREPWTFPELRMSAEAFAAMNRPQRFQSFRVNRPIDPATTLDELLFEPFHTLERKEP